MSSNSGGLLPPYPCCEQFHHKIKCPRCGADNPIVLAALNALSIHFSESGRQSVQGSTSVSLSTAVPPLASSSTSRKASRAVPPAIMSDQMSSALNLVIDNYNRVASAPVPAPSQSGSGRKVSTASQLMTNQTLRTPSSTGTQSLQVRPAPEKTAAPRLPFGMISQPWLAFEVQSTPVEPLPHETRKALSSSGVTSQKSLEPTTPKPQASSSASRSAKQAAAPASSVQETRSSEPISSLSMLPKSARYGSFPSSSNSVHSQSTVPASAPPLHVSGSNPTKSKAGGIAPARVHLAKAALETFNRGNALDLRLKRFPGMICTVCGNAHPSGHCNESRIHMWWEIFLRVDSFPPPQDKCTICTKPQLALRHTTKEHGCGQYYDHPDNRALGKFVAYYNPAPGLSRREPYWKNRSDIPPLELMLEAGQKDPGSIDEWKAQFNACKDSNDKTALPRFYFQVTERQIEHEKHMIAKADGGQLQDRGSRPSPRDPVSSSVDKAKPGWAQSRKEKGSKWRCPSPGCTPEDDRLPSDEYVAWLWEFLGDNERDSVLQLFKTWSSQKDAEDDLFWTLEDKRSARVSSRNEAMKLFYEVEAGASQRLKGRVMPGRQGGPLTERNQFRTRFQVNAPFQWKDGWGFPEIIGAKSRLSLLSKPSLNTIVLPNRNTTVQQDGKGDLEAPARRSLNYHIQDYPLQDEQFSTHLRDWYGVILKGLGDSDDWQGLVIQITEKLHGAKQNLLSMSVTGMEDFDKARPAMEAHIKAVKDSINSLLGHLRLRAEALKSQLDCQDSDVQVSKDTFDSHVRHIESCFAVYNASIDSSLRTLSADKWAKQVLHQASKSGGGTLFVGWGYLMGDMMPAESRVKAVIPRLAWPLDVSMDMDFGATDGRWASADVEAPDHSTGVVPVGGS